MTAWSERPTQTTSAPFTSDRQRRHLGAGGKCSVAAKARAIAPAGVDRVRAVLLIAQAQ